MYPYYLFSQPNFSLKPLYEKVKEELLKIADGDPYLLLIDDISVLLSLGVSAIHVQDFVQYCQVNVCTQQQVCLMNRVYRYIRSQMMSQSVCKEQKV